MLCASAPFFGARTQLASTAASSSSLRKSTSPTVACSHTVLARSDCATCKTTPAISRAGQVNNTNTSPRRPSKVSAGASAAVSASTIRTPRYSPDIRCLSLPSTPLARQRPVFDSLSLQIERLLSQLPDAEPTMAQDVLWSERARGCALFRVRLPPHGAAEQQPEQNRIKPKA
eukprot:3439925-Rhodomonas_salina.5